MQPALDIIVVNWNAGRQLFECLQSITEREPGFNLNRVVIVDNGSVDGSLAGLESIDLPLVIIRNDTNRGFAAACNQGAAGSFADYLLFLNPDTVLNQESLSRPVAFMEEPTNRSIGIVGIQLVDENGTPSRKCCRFPTASMFFYQMIGLAQLAPRRFPSYTMTEWAHNESREVGHVMGAFYMIRRPLFNDLNGFDERFFVYLEDLDLSVRARQFGWSSHFLADAQAFHKGGGTSEQIKATRLFYALRSRMQYSYKHFTLASATILLLTTVVLEPLARLGWALKRRSAQEMMATVVGTFRLLVWIGLAPLRRGKP